MKTYFVVRDRRYRHDSVRKGWIAIAEYLPETGQPLSVIPPEVSAHHRANCSIMGYAPLRGLTVKQLKMLSRLYQGTNGQLILSPNRWGDISAYKVTSPQPQP